MSKFRSKPIEVEAFRWLGPNNPSHQAVRSELISSAKDHCKWYVITIHEQRAYLEPGDWIITEPDGKHHYPCKHDIFIHRYEAIDK